MSDPLLTVCPACGAPTFVKQVTAAGFQLKGSGWYVTDFRGDKQAGKPAEAATTATKPDAGEPSEGGDAKGGDTAADKPPQGRRRRARRQAATPRSAGGRQPRPPRRRRAAGQRRRRRAAAAASPSASPRSRVKKYLIAGLLVWLPLAVTIWVLQAVLGLLDGVFVWLLDGSQAVLPERQRTPRSSMLQRIPGLGVLVMLIGLLLTGVFATNIVGQWCAAPGPPAAQQDPDRQVDLQLGASRSRTRCSRAAATPFARRCWCSTRAPGSLDDRLRHRQARRRGGARTCRGDYLSVYVPTTPNPTSGFFLMVPRADVIALAMSVDEALKYVISMGVVAPPTRRASAGRRASRATPSPGCAARPSSASSRVAATRAAGASAHRTSRRASRPRHRRSHDPSTNMLGVMR